MTDERQCLQDSLHTREEAIKAAGQLVAAANDKFAFLMIHSKDDLKATKGPAAA